MTDEGMILGARVRLCRKIGGRYPGAMYEIDPGPIGTVIAVHALPDDHDGSQHIAEVKFDDLIADLADWGNVLHVWAMADHGDCSPADFALD
jgi:hypothetical protein